MHTYLMRIKMAMLTNCLCSRSFATANIFQVGMSLRSLLNIKLLKWLTMINTLWQSVVSMPYNCITVSYIIISVILCNLDDCFSHLHDEIKYCKTAEWLILTCKNHTRNIFKDSGHDFFFYNVPYFELKFLNQYLN